VPVGHYYINAAWQCNSKALRKHVKDPLYTLKAKVKKIAQKNQLDPPRGKTSGSTSKYFQVRDAVPDGHYCNKAECPCHPKALRKHVKGPSIDIEGIGKKNRTAKNST
jgi:hypothetical protein